MPRGQIHPLSLITTQEIDNVLILKRQIGEAVVIGDNVFCKVLSVTGDYVCLGFEAP